MTTISSPPPVARQFPLEPGQRIYFANVSWDYYTRTLHAIEDAGFHYRVTFDNGRMEIMTTGARHEGIKTLTGRLVERYGEEMNIPVNGLGGVTLRHENLQKGLEADECYYIPTPMPPMGHGGEELDLNKYPPPDLAIEVDITSGSIPKHPIYAALGVPEFWQYDGKKIVPYHPQPNGTYRPSDHSVAFPNRPIDELNRFIAMAVAGQPQHEVVIAFVAWVRATLKR